LQPKIESAIRIVASLALVPIVLTSDVMRISCKCLSLD